MSKSSSNNVSSIPQNHNCSRSIPGKLLMLMKNSTIRLASQAASRQSHRFSSKCTTVDEPEDASAESPDHETGQGYCYRHLHVCHEEEESGNDVSPLQAPRRESYSSGLPTASSPPPHPPRPRLRHSPPDHYSVSNEALIFSLILKKRKESFSGISEEILKNEKKT